MGSSTCIRARQTREIKRAARHAWRMGRGLSRYVVINFPKPEEGEELAAKRMFQSIRKKCWSWWCHKREANPSLGPLTDLHTWEHRNGVLHVNWLIHVPENMVEEFAKKRARWIAKHLKEHPIEAVKDKEIYNLNGLLDYVLKGTEAEKAPRFGIVHVDQGIVWGRRTAASKNLGRTARERDWSTGTVLRQDWKFRRPSIHAPGRTEAHSH